MGKIEELEAKITKVVERMAALRDENAKLKAECTSLKSHLALVDSENGKAQHVLAAYENLRKTREQVTHRLERALGTLNSLKPS